eukprot:1701067-Prorocentrum_lima.AAC.1
MLSAVGAAKGRTGGFGKLGGACRIGGRGLTGGPPFAPGVCTGPGWGGAAEATREAGPAATCPT